MGDDERKVRLDERYAKPNENSGVEVDYSDAVFRIKLFLLR